MSNTDLQLLIQIWILVWIYLAYRVVKGIFKIIFWTLKTRNMDIIESVRPLTEVEKKHKKKK